MIGLRQGLAKSSCQLFGTGTLGYLPLVCGHFDATTAELSGCGRLYGLQRLDYLPSGLLQKKICRQLWQPNSPLPGLGTDTLQPLLTKDMCSVLEASEKRFSFLIRERNMKRKFFCRLLPFYSITRRCDVWSCGSHVVTMRNNG